MSLQATCGYFGVWPSCCIGFISPYGRCYLRGCQFNLLLALFTRRLAGTLAPFKFSPHQGWQCPESQAPLPWRKCPAAPWLRAGVTLRWGGMHDFWMCVGRVCDWLHNIYQFLVVLNARTLYSPREVVKYVSYGALISFVEINVNFAVID